MDRLTLPELALLADALPWYAKWLHGLAWRKSGTEARAYRERAGRAWALSEKVQARLREASRDGP